MEKLSKGLSQPAEIRATKETFVRRSALPVWAKLRETQVVTMAVSLLLNGRACLVEIPVDTNISNHSRQTRRGVYAQRLRVHLRCHHPSAGVRESCLVSLVSVCGERLAKDSFCMYTRGSRRKDRRGRVCKVSMWKRERAPQDFLKDSRPAPADRIRLKRVLSSRQQFPRF